MNNEIFIKLYNDIENEIIKNYHLGDSYQGAFVYYKNNVVKDRITRIKIDQIRKIRNLLVHDDLINNYDMFMVSDEVIEFMKKLLDILTKPIKAKDIFISFNNLFSCMLNSNTETTIKEMEKRGFSHTPVIDINKKVIGVFSESTIFSYLINNNGTINISSTSTLKDFQNLINLDAHRSDKFTFINKEMHLNEVVALFRLYEGKRKKLKMIFVTSNGQSSGILEGIITPYDVFKIS